ncbi:hypothetical protein, partial [Burkholderia ambifaria]|uniref:hypothetical protein n=1 Tax=Burkholderia ambifaria TaxID=152480 RepID=UPI001ABB5981
TAWRTSHVRNPFALLEIMNIGLASFSRSIYATTPLLAQGTAWIHRPSARFVAQPSRTFAHIALANIEHT